jgi:aspartate kinase
MLSIHEPRPLKVLKFGGTLLRDESARRQVAAEIVSYVRPGSLPLIVVSAMGRRGDPYATDTLQQLLGGAQRRPDPIALDLLLSCGETIAAALMAQLLADHGVRALPMTAYTAGIHTSTRHGDADLLGVDPTHILASLSEGLIPVVAGFQGVDWSGQVTTLGRGGSDVTAMALGAALGAEVEIVKDVTGVMTCDPALSPEARLVPRISYPAMHRLAILGNRVVQTRALRLGWRRGVPLTIRGLACKEGTKVTMPDEKPGPDEVRRETFGLACRAGLTMIRAETERAREQVLRLLEQIGEDIDCSFATGTSSMICLPRSSARRLLSLVDRAAVREIASACARVSIVAEESQGASWLLHGEEALHSASVPVIAVSSHGCSATYVVPEAHFDLAVQTIHQYATESLPRQVDVALPAAGGIAL